MDWFDKAVEQIEKDHEDGNIDDAEYKEQMRDVQEEYKQEAQDAAEEAYGDYFM